MGSLVLKGFLRGLFLCAVDPPQRLETTGKASAQFLSTGGGEIRFIFKYAVGNLQIFKKKETGIAAAQLAPIIDPVQSFHLRLGQAVLEDAVRRFRIETLVVFP